jgi:predicted membrane chloride channel (bestrophin family)
MEDKIGKLDDAFLFCLASMGIITSFIEINKNDFSQIITAIPFLLLGIVLPFFIGVKVVGSNPAGPTTTFFKKCGSENLAMF